MRLDELRTQALRHVAAGDFTRALRLHAHLVARLPDDLDGRMRTGDLCVMLGQLDPARMVYAAVAYLDLQSGRPLHALVAMRALADLGEDAEPLRDALAKLYASDSPRVARVGARLSPHPPDTDVGAPPDKNEELGSALRDATRLAADTTSIREFPSQLQPVPLLSDLTAPALHRMLRCATVVRLMHGQVVIRRGDPGDGFYFIAAGCVRVLSPPARGEGPGRDASDAHDDRPDTGDTGEGAAPVEVARLYEGAMFGEMALLTAEPRSATVEVVGAADLIFFGREAIAAAAEELPQLAIGLSRFARERVVHNAAAVSPLFAPFSSAERGELLRRFTLREYAGGEVIVEEGAAPPGLVLVAAGELAAIEGDGPFERVEAVVRPGEIALAPAMLARGPATRAVRATRQSLVLVLPRDYFDRLVMTVPEVKAYLESLG